MTLAALALCAVAKLKAVAADQVRTLAQADGLLSDLPLLISTRSSRTEISLDGSAAEGVFPSPSAILLN